MIVDFPSQPACLKFLTQDERDRLINRLTGECVILFSLCSAEI